MLLTDTLSRAYSDDYERSATESEVECIHATHFLLVPDHQLKELQRETACDPTLQFVKKAILDGFADSQRMNNQQPFTSTVFPQIIAGGDYSREGGNSREAITPMYFKYCSLEVVP